MKAIVKKTGNGACVYLPKEYIGKEVEVTLPGLIKADSKPITEDLRPLAIKIFKLIEPDIRAISREEAESAIEEAKRY